ncbi:MAG: 50S ribosomal protein L3 [Deltaproteobacteria bacterium]|nr:50S ribosomal protein L3 [Deltaproteobacteria bacterium]
MKVRALLGRKIGMSQVFDAKGEVVPVSVVQAGPCVVLEKKSAKGKDGYSAVKIGFEKAREKSVNKPDGGFYKKLDIAPLKHVREIRVPEEQLAEFEVGAELNATLFEVGDVVNVVGNSRGRGFAGVIKRWGFAGKRMSHGTHQYTRHPGSVSAHSWPARIFKGKKMPGQFGNVRKTQESLTVIQVIPEKNLLLLKGPVPGGRNSVVLVKTSPKKWKRG